MPKNNEISTTRPTKIRQQSKRQSDTASFKSAQNTKLPLEKATIFHTATQNYVEKNEPFVYEKSTLCADTGCLESVVRDRRRPRGARVAAPLAGAYVKKLRQPFVFAIITHLSRNTDGTVWPESCARTCRVFLRFLFGDFLFGFVVSVGFFSGCLDLKKKNCWAFLYLYFYLTCVNWDSLDLKFDKINQFFQIWN